MKRYFVFFLLQLTIVAHSAVEDALVKIYQTRNAYDYNSPWSPPSQSKARGSGFIISNTHILTNAHLVAQSAFIQVKKEGDVQRYTAEVEFFGCDCDLAILKVDDESFFEDVEPLSFSSGIASVQEKVSLYGYPIGGEDLSITEGIISRIEVAPYAFSGENLLCSQIDAPLNFGNSGGPVLSNGLVVGVAHQGFMGGQNLGYMIPVPIIEHFLSEFEDNEYLGFPKGGIHVQKMENPALRSFYQMEKDQSGVLVIKVNQNSFVRDIILPGDIILSIDGVPIANDATIEFQQRRRISLSYVISSKHYNEFVDMEVLRDGEKLNITAFMEKHPSPFESVEECPTYYIYGGMVFQRLTWSYFVNAFDDRPPSIDLLGLIKGNDSDAETVVLSRVLPDKLTTGYQMLVDEIVQTVNDKEIHSMQELIETFESHEGPFYRILFQSGLEIVIDREDAELRHEKILQNYSITSDRSPHLR